MKAADILGIPVIATEQYPKGLGNTVSEIDVSKVRVLVGPAHSRMLTQVERVIVFYQVTKFVCHCGYCGYLQAKVFSKTVFSMVIPEVEEILRADDQRKSDVLFGIEVRRREGEREGGREREREGGRERGYPFVVAKVSLKGWLAFRGEVLGTVGCDNRLASSAGFNRQLLMG